MRLRTLGCLSALLTLTLTAQSSTAQAETKAKTAKSGVTQSQEVAAGDLALGKPVPTTPTPAAAPPDTADNRYVYSPSLAATPQTPPQPAAVAAPAPEPMPEADVKSDLPKRLPYRNELTMQGYVLGEQKRWWMVGVGGAVFAIGYVVALGVAGDNDFKNGLGFAAIPIAGPWVALAMHEPCDEEDFGAPSSSIVTCNDSAINSGMIGSGVLQAGGALVLALGLGSSRQVWIREDLAVQVTPVLGRNANGLSLSGTF